MIELRNGKLKIDSKRSALEILLDLSIVAMLTVLFAFNFRFGERNYIYHAALISVVGLTFLSAYSADRLSRSSYRRYGTASLFCSASSRPSGRHIMSAILYIIYRECFR